MKVLLGSIPAVFYNRRYRIVNGGSVEVGSVRRVVGLEECRVADVNVKCQVPNDDAENIGPVSQLS